MMPSYSSMVDNTAEVLMEIDSPTKNYLPPPSANKTSTKITATTNGIILKMDSESETADQNAITTSSVNAANNDGDGDDGQQQQLEQPSKTKVCCTVQYKYRKP
jgi:hypothetical protein